MPIPSAPTAPPIRSGSLLKVSDDGLRFELGTELSTNYCYEYLQSAFSRVRFDTIAGATQLFTEEMLVKWVQEAIRKTGIRDIVCGGGVFMNVKANMLLAQLPEVRSIYVMPSAADESLSIGACLCRHYDNNNNGDFSASRLTNLYLGGADDAAAENAAVEDARNALQVAVEQPGNMNEAIADLLAKGEIVAVCRGRMEWGARALGNRSILSSAADPRRIDEINNMIKMRDFWMPFAPEHQGGIGTPLFRDRQEYRTRFHDLRVSLAARERERPGGRLPSKGPHHSSAGGQKDRQPGLSCSHRWLRAADRSRRRSQHIVQSAWRADRHDIIGRGTRAGEVWSAPSRFEQPHYIESFAIGAEENVDPQAEVAEFYALLRYPGPDALITYLWPNRVDRFVPKGPFTFLDAGCGAGRHTAGMLDRYPQARGYCIDLSQPSLHAASALLEAKGFVDRVKLWKASFLDPIPVPEPVDIALAIGTIHHCADPARALTNITAAVKPGGYVACMVYGARGHRRRYEIKEAVEILATDLSDTEGLYRSFQGKYDSWLDKTPRVLIRNARNRASHFLNRALGRKRYGYRADRQTSVFILDSIASPIDLAFDTAGVRQLVETAGLEIVAMFGVGRHAPSLLPDGWHWDNLDFWQKTRLSELLDPDPKSWSFIARKPR